MFAVLQSQAEKKCLHVCESEYIFIGIGDKQMATLKNIQKLFGDVETKLKKPLNWKHVEKLTRGKLEDKEGITRLAQLNQLFEAHGIESIKGEYVSHYWQDTNALYVNMGDSYLPTFIFDTRLKRIIVGDVAWFVQSRKIEN